MTERTHIAQLNIGRLVADPDDPRVGAFMRAIDAINGLGKRSPGFVWMMEGSGAPNEGNTAAKIDGDPRFISNLTVWESVEALGAFAFNTAHRQFYERRAEWFEALGERHFVMWPVAPGHRPTLEEGLERLDALRRDGPSDAAFGWESVDPEIMARLRRCAAVAAE